MKLKTAPGTPSASLAEKLAKLGLHTVTDLILHLPLRYLDETKILPIAAARPGEWLQTDVVILSSQCPKKTLVCQVEDDSGTLILRFFKCYPSQVAALKPGVKLRISGEVREGFFGLEMVHPQWRVLKNNDEALPLHLTPIYPTTGGLAQKTLRKIIQKSLSEADLADTLPSKILFELNLPSFENSVRYLHAPPALGNTLTKEQAIERLKLDELLALQLAMTLYRKKNQDEPALPLASRGELANTLLKSLPFSLTAAQAKAYREIRADLDRPYPMQRLLQGEVGSGKTIVAALAALQAIETNSQVAFMAPTELLAEQHYRKLSALLAPLGIELAWLAAGSTRQDKGQTLKALGEGRCLFVVGTHALFQERVEFARLALIIIDEQHRFGVEQRLALRNKARVRPHQLMMSATPIPRSLAMSYYADMDISTIAELPPGRTPVTTKLFSEGKRQEVATRVKQACLAGRQAYWVCPLIEESEALQLKAAEHTFLELKTLLPELRVGMIHGRLASADKLAVMEAFVQGNIQLLVATSVIEVGVDVANASIMVIEHAERLGLAQLHQLRGRVGRGTAQSSCILLYQTPLSENARQRLKIIYEHQDGFEIASLDLAMRGPGELLGARQAGLPVLRIAEISEDGALLAQARGLAERLLHAHPEYAEKHIKRWQPAAAAYLAT